MKRWVALFSQTGSEIVEVSRLLDRWPDVIVYNTNITDPRSKYFKSNRATINEGIGAIQCVPFNPIEEDYKSIFQKDDIITLNGWLRIIPSSICTEFDIYNGHPGLITKYPELKGKDPQAKAVELKLLESGCVIHKVISEVDAGEILMSQSVNIVDKPLDVVIKDLHKISIQLWVEFLRSKL